MKRVYINLVIPFFILLFFNTFNTDSQTTSAEERAKSGAVKELMNRFYDALRGGDANTMTEFFLTDALIMPAESFTRAGYRSIREYYQELFFFILSYGPPGVEKRLAGLVLLFSFKLVSLTRDIQRLG